MPIGLLVATLYLAPALWALYTLPSCAKPTEATKKVEEGFEPTGRVEPTPVETVPTARNPFMNVLIDEIKYNPTRPPAKYIGDPGVQDSLDSFFRVQWSSDPTDVFGKTQSQREFITMPSTSVPNDRGSFQDWLYKIPGKTCKEGGREACYPGTDGAALPWLNN